MSVDCRAKIVYGWLIDNDEYYDFMQAEEKKSKETGIYYDYDYLHCINAYSRDTDYVYGIEVAGTDYIQFIDPDLLTYFSEQGDDDEDWLDCVKQFKQDFPDKYANVKPAFFLVCNWW